METLSHKLNKFLSDCRDKTFAYMRKRFDGLDDESRQDVFQEASMALFDNIANGKFRSGDASMYTYFLSIVNNQANKAVRGLGKTVSIDELVRVKPNEEDDFQDEQLDKLIGLCDDDAVQNEDVHHRLQVLVRAITQSLTDKCQELLWGHYGDNLTWETLAQMNGLANANVAKSSANRCRSQFKDKFNELSARQYENR